MRFLILSFLALLLLISFMENDQSRHNRTYQEEKDTLQFAALRVLENNCNECHRTKKPSYYFTAKTMDYFAVDINTQVFVKGKMPKGRKNQLSTEDREILRLWLEMKLKTKR